jgi:hypothetical protein
MPHTDTPTGGTQRTMGLPIKLPFAASAKEPSPPLRTSSACPGFRASYLDRPQWDVHEAKVHREDLGAVADLDEAGARWVRV